ncbi:MAG TPA: RNA-binding domain-containing protein, partial [Streptosporangiaceae bacterium]
VHYIVFEYLSGGTLADYLLDAGQRPLDEVLRLKTIAAFLNTGGGTLVIGVADDGEVLGLEPDRAGNATEELLGRSLIGYFSERWPT